MKKLLPSLFALFAIVGQCQADGYGYYRPYYYAVPVYEYQTVIVQATLYPSFAFSYFPPALTAAMSGYSTQTTTVTQTTTTIVAPVAQAQGSQTVAYSAGQQEDAPVASGGIGAARIFESRCASCHGADAPKGVRYDGRWTRNGKAMNRAAVLLAVSGRHPRGVVMPPAAKADATKRLPEAEQAAIAEWALREDE